MAGTTRPRRQHPRSARRRARRARSPSRRTSTAPSCCSPRCSRCPPSGPAMLQRIERGDASASSRSIAHARRRRRSEGVGDAASRSSARHVGLGRRADRRRLRWSPASSSASRQVGFKPSAAGAQAGLQEAQPDRRASRTCSARTRSFETGKTIAKVGVVGAIVALAVLPKLDELAALVGMPPVALLPRARRHRRCAIAQRAAVAYLVIALADFVYQRYRHEKELRMDKQEVKDEHKQQELPAEVKAQQRRRGDGARPRAHDGRRPDRRRRRHQPDPLLRRAALRRRAARRPMSSPRARTTSRCAIRELAREHGVAVVPDPPLARALHASVEVGQHDPRGALPGRRPAARLRLPRRRRARTGRRMNTILKKAGAPRRPARRRRGRAGRRDDDHPAAAVPARPRDHAEHLGGAGDRRGDALRAARARLLVLPVAAAAHDAVPAGDQRLA